MQITTEQLLELGFKTSQVKARTYCHKYVDHNFYVFINFLGDEVVDSGLMCEHGDGETSISVDFETIDNVKLLIKMLCTEE